jgi:hypothetical protein
VTADSGPCLRVSSLPPDPNSWELGLVNRHCAIVTVCLLSMCYPFVPFGPCLSVPFLRGQPRGAAPTGNRYGEPVRGTGKPGKRIVDIVLLSNPRLPRPANARAASWGRLHGYVVICSSNRASPIEAAGRFLSSDFSLSVCGHSFVVC